MSAPLLKFSGLTVAFDARKAVDGLDLTVERGEIVALVGESGSGKTQAILAMMGLSPPNARVSGSAVFDGVEMIGAPRRVLDALRGAEVAMIFQEPMTALDPLVSIGAQIAAPLRAHGGLSKRAAWARAGELLAETQVRDAAARLKDFPHQFSGGERQRAMIAMAIANAPKLIVADEPTTALDATVQAQILDLLLALRAKYGLAILIVSHDLNLVRRFAAKVAVMRGGLLQECGPTADVFAAPKAEYTRALIAAEPSGRKPPILAGSPILLEAEGVRVQFRRRGGWLGSAPFDAVAGVDLTLRRGETLALVGESGSGKSTLARALLRLTPANGSVRFAGVDLATLAPKRLRAMRRRMQLVFQDPFGALSPRLSVARIVGEGLLTHEPTLSRAEHEARIVDVLAAVGIDPARRAATPEAFSGGQRQRVAIARAIVLKPDLIALDEPTSALDRSVQREILELLRRLQNEHGLSYIFITHDLAVARAMADRLAVMRAGRIVETGVAAEVFAAPKTEYARALIAAAGFGRA